jgi:DNA-binding NtrC family response regulator
MPETPGFIRSAEGGSLFLDEIGEITKRMQAALLVAFDPAGLFTVLGEQKPRRANVRFICATNRDLSELKNDFAARFIAIIEIPALSARREDIPLIARQLMIAASERDAAAEARRFLRRGPTRMEVNFDRGLISRLVQVEHPTNVRSIERFLARAIAESPEETLRTTADLMTAPTPARAVAALTEDTIRAALARHEGNVSAAARELGVGRDTLRRATGMKKPK